MEEKGACLPGLPYAASCEMVYPRGIFDCREESRKLQPGISCVPAKRSMHDRIFRP